MTSNFIDAPHRQIHCPAKTDHIYKTSHIMNEFLVVNATAKY